MFQNLSVTDWTILVYGVLAFVLGLTGIVGPDGQLRTMGVPTPAQRQEGDFTIASMGASSFAATNMGVLYVAGTLMHWPGFALFTIYARTIMAIGFVFMMATGRAPRQFTGATLWEAIGALITAGALLIWGA